MQQTLFLVPQSWLEGPLLIAWLVLGGVIMAALALRKGQPADAFSFLPIYIVVAAIFYFVAPRVGITDINPADPNGPEIKVGLAIRGYGVMMLAGIFAGVGLSVYRGQRQGFDPEKIITLAFWMCICGVIGARLFYVIQKRDQFSGSIPEMLGEMINMTQGGLVVYGSLIGATAGGAFYLWYSKIPMLRMADIAMPGMLVGLALGRIGCLMNGCCFGGVCDIPQIAQPFPAGSPPYLRQIETGELLGIRPEKTLASDDLPIRPEAAERYAKSILPGSLAEQAGVRPEQWYAIGFTSNRPDKELRAIKQRGLTIDSSVAISQGDQWHSVPFNDLPSQSLGVYPTQILAAINAALLAALLWWYFPFRRRNGQVFALGIILYSVTRFCLELIRRDEAGQFGTQLTISQWVSLIVVLGGVLLFVAGPRKEQDSLERRVAGPRDRSAGTA